MKRSEETSSLRREKVDGELSQEEIYGQLLKFISANFLFDGQGTVNREDRLFEEGIISVWRGRRWIAETR